VAGARPRGAKGRITAAWQPNRICRNTIGSLNYDNSRTMNCETDCPADWIRAWDFSCAHPKPRARRAAIAMDE
jgi:hypothetical protein